MSGIKDLLVFNLMEAWAQPAETHTCLKPHPLAVQHPVTLYVIDVNFEWQAFRQMGGNMSVI